MGGLTTPYQDPQYKLRDWGIPPLTKISTMQSITGCALLLLHVIPQTALAGTTPEQV